MFDSRIQFKRRQEKRKIKTKCNIKMLAIIPNIPVITVYKWTKFSPWINIKSIYVIFVKETLKLWI